MGAGVPGGQTGGSLEDGQISGSVTSSITGAQGGRGRVTLCPGDDMNTPRFSLKVPYAGSDRP